VERVHCVLCGGGRSDAVHTTRDRLSAGGERGGPPAAAGGPPRSPTFTLVRCRSCGLVYLDPRPAADEIGAYYPDDYSAPPGTGGRLARLEDAWRTRQQREVVTWLADLKPSRGRLFDIGCGTGELTAALRGDGWRAEGLEPSPRSAALARERHGLTIHEATFETADLAEAGYDAVVLASVLEHLPDPIAALRRVRDLLAAGGLVAVLFLPLLDSPLAHLAGGRWLDLDAPRHFYQFDSRTFARCAATAGLRIADTRGYSRRHNAALWTALAFPALKKQRVHVIQRHRPVAAAARKAAFLAATTAFRPLTRAEAVAGREPLRSYFLVAS